MLWKPNKKSGQGNGMAWLARLDFSSASWYPDCMWCPREGRGQDSTGQSPPLATISFQTAELSFPTLHSTVPHPHSAKLPDLTVSCSLPQFLDAIPLQSLCPRISCSLVFLSLDFLLSSYRMDTVPLEIIPTGQWTWGIASQNTSSICLVSVSQTHSHSFSLSSSSHHFMNINYIPGSICDWGKKSELATMLLLSGFPV